MQLIEQTVISLAPRARGYHLITADLMAELTELERVSAGLLHLFIRHTSASILITENADPNVLVDVQSHFDDLAPEDPSRYVHDEEGIDDMPAHLKVMHQGSDLTIPVNQGQLMLGTWQGIFLGEHRNRAGSRQIVATLSGLTD